MLSYKGMLYIYMYSGFNKLEIVKACVHVSRSMEIGYNTGVISVHITPE